MKPLLAVHIRTDLAPDLSIEQVADVCNAAMDREFGRAGPEVVSVRPLLSVDDLRAYESGEMVLYRKPARKVGDKIIYEREGQRVELEQTRLSL